ncbi:hypothetical protein [Prevotella ihumii]|uniref:hypothetical protein n=1 Tax=Prevotella ihumii TaxID=1917878 RepID=UPI000981E3FC|nr:hypothetical protein [Prevotella ihumii]
MFNDSNANEPIYRTLSDIRLRKAQLLTEITKESNSMNVLWSSLFQKPNNSATPSKRFSGVMATGVGVVDAVILGWKLYRKFSGKPKQKGMFSFFGKKRK